MSDALAVQNSDRLEAIAVEIETIQGVALLKIGERLMEARDLFKYDRDEGGFSGWVDKRLSFTGRTAYKLIGVFEAFGSECANNIHTLPKSVLYALAAPSTPEPVREEAMRRVEAGEPVDLDVVMKLKRELVDAKDAAKDAKQDVKVQRSEAHTPCAVSRRPGAGRGRPLAWRRRVGHAAGSDAPQSSRPVR